MDLSTINGESAAQTCWVRRTVVIHSRLAWRHERARAGIKSQHGLQAIPFEERAARLAGGLLQPIEPDALKSAITKALCADLCDLDSIMGALALPEIAACRSRLVPEITIFSANTDDHSATHVGGLPMRPAYRHTGVIDLVIDCETDVGPSPQQIGLYSKQMRDYLVATSASEDLLVFVTAGRLVRIRPQF
jgi:hypothetical protein